MRSSMKARVDRKERLKAVLGWPYLDDVRLHELSVHHVEARVSAALGKGYSVQTVKHIRNVLGVIVTQSYESTLLYRRESSFPGATAQGDSPTGLAVYLDACKEDS